MAWALGENLEYSSAATLGTLTWSPAATIPIGALIVLLQCSNAAAVVSTVADNSTQAGAANTYDTTLGTVSGTTLKGGVIVCVATRSILTTDVITITYVGTASRRSGRLITFTGQASGTPTAIEDVASATNSVTASPITMGPTGALAGTGELVLGCSFWKGGGVLSGMADSTSGYTASPCAVGSGGTVTSVESNFSYKTTGGTGAETDSHTFTTFTSGCGIIVAFKPPAVAVTARSLISVVRRVGSGG